MSLIRCGGNKRYTTCETMVSLRNESSLNSETSLGNLATVAGWPSWIWDSKNSTQIVTINVVKPCHLVVQQFHQSRVESSQQHYASVSGSVSNVYTIVATSSQAITEIEFDATTAGTVTVTFNDNHSAIYGYAVTAEA